MMKKVIFVCLLSVTLCISQPTAKPEAVTQAPETKATNATEKAAETNLSVTTLAPHSNETSPSQSTIPKETKDNSNSTKSDKIPPQNKVEPTKKEEVKPTENASVPSTQSNETKPDGKSTETSTEKKASVTTPPPTPVKPSVAPHDATEKPIVQARGFDGASFIGGIILTLGLLAIGFMGFKYYKNQTERNYHTL